MPLARLKSQLAFLSFRELCWSILLFYNTFGVLFLAPLNVVSNSKNSKNKHFVVYIPFNTLHNDLEDELNNEMVKLSKKP